MEKKLNIQITEIFMAKAGKTGWDRRFHGTIKRTKDENDKSMVYGKIKINDGFIYAMAEDQWILGDMLDQMVLMILDEKIHDNKGVSFERYGLQYHMN